MALTETDSVNIIQEIVKLLAAKGLTLGEAENILSESRGYLTKYIIEVTDKQREVLLNKLIS